MAPQQHQEKRICRILVADDEDQFLNLYNEIFADNRELTCTIEETANEQPEAIFFDVTLCNQATEAIENVRKSIEEKDPYVIAFIDIRMPLPEDGLSAGEQIRKLDPNIEIVFVTGFQDFDPVEIASRVPPVHKIFYIQKPFSVYELLHFAYALSCKWIFEDNSRMLKENLAEANTALKVLLSQRENDKNALMETTLGNMRQIVASTLDKLKSTKLTDIQNKLVSTLESNIEEITLPLLGQAGIKSYNLTAMELQTANYVKSGFSNKEIAEMLDISPSTVMTHRHKIREKLGLKNKKVNLRAHLISLG